jgi:hypothetical protein
MTAPDEETPPPLPLNEAEYRIELRKELADLELAQGLFWSKYKHDRIRRLQHRLGIPAN